MSELYVIIDPEHCAERDPVWVGEQALAGGAALLQLRAKQLDDEALVKLAMQLARRCRDRGVPFWLNDRVDLVERVGADGLHLGQHDVPVPEARRLLGDLMLGLSTHSLAQAEAAQKAGVDLIGFGPIFPTRSKLHPDPVVGLELLATLCPTFELPVVAIGGVQLENAQQVARAGARYAAVISAVCGAVDPRAASAALVSALR